MLENVSLITIVKNGHEMFKLWYQYYSKFIPQSNITVLDFGSTDGGTANLNCNVLAYPDFSTEKIHQGNQLINALKVDLLKKTKFVMYADYDEFIFYSGAWADLFQGDKKYFTPKGFEVVQNTKLEPSVDFSKNIFDQRSFWYRCSLYDKPLITGIDFQWAPGNHSAYLPMVIKKRDGSRRIDNSILKPNYVDGLYLIHLHRLDRDSCQNLNKRNIVERPNPTGGQHNYLVGDEFQQWWDQAERQISKIPAEIQIKLRSTFA